MIVLAKENPATTFCAPFETLTLTATDAAARQVIITDAHGREYARHGVRPNTPLRLAVRGAAGTHVVTLRDGAGAALARATFVLRATTQIACNRGPYAALARRIEHFLERNDERAGVLINGRLHRMLVTWGRDHVHTLKVQKYFMPDVTSGLDYWLDTQAANGMFWDCLHPNPCYPAPTWFGEALGQEYSRYDDQMNIVVRRIPVEADCEFLYTEGVWHAWKATGDDAWMARQLPRLEKALQYNTSHPARWSTRHQLVRRSMCMDSWDFVNPHYCHGDHRCINPGDPQFLFHGDNSGVYASYWRLAEMHAHLGNAARARQLRAAGEALRRRANKKLFYETTYGHMIPETLPEKEVYALVGDERARMSLSLGYTINRGLPTHAMALKILQEYQRRGRAKKHESFAEWWTMDPPYQDAQWPVRGTGGSSVGEYMNGAICTIIAGEVARAAFAHGCEAYGVDILERVWQLSERDHGELFQVYRRLPATARVPPARFAYVDLRGVANRGLRYGARKGVQAWGERGNDLRNLPTGRQTFGLVSFDVIDPARNAGKAVLHVDADPKVAPNKVTMHVPRRTGRSLYFLHALPRAVPAHGVAGSYLVTYADGAIERIFVRNNHEIGLWWDISDTPARRHDSLDPVDRATTRVAWRGANAQWKNVGVFMFGWNNPRPAVPVTAITVEAAACGAGCGGIMLAAISFSNQPVKFEERIRSHGLPDCWAQAAVYYALAEGLAGIEDTGRAFDRVRIAPRWSASPATRAEVTLHYPASGGYCAYRYRHERARRRIVLDMTGSFTQAQVQCLLPKGATATRVRIGTRPLAFALQTIERSVYAVFDVAKLPTAPVWIDYQ
ncbi:MAG: hypothetical protein NTV22_12700 [bacterium]|nr:hypothetical protein [bacterium]